MKIAAKISLFTLVLFIVISSFSTYIVSSNSEDNKAISPATIELNSTLSNNDSELDIAQVLDSKIERFMARWGVVGASFALMKDEKLIYAKGYGWANKEREERCGPHNIFRVASVSKLITAVAIMKLCDEGKLTLESKLFGSGGVLQDSFPNYSDKRLEMITVEHLLRHRGGFSTRAGDPLFSLAQIGENLNLKRAVNRTELTSYILRKRLSFTPGSGTSYSNFGYLLLSIVIEAITEQSYWSYIKEEILEPNGVVDFQQAKNFYQERYHNEVRYYPTPGDAPILPFYGGKDSVMRCYGGNNIELLEGAGGWLASAAELLRFVALIDGKEGIPDILSSESIAQMHSSSTSELPIGWMRSLPDGTLIRSGYFSGSNALIRHNSNGYSWAFLTNSSTWKSGGLYRYIDFTIRDALTTIDEWPKERDLFLGSN